MYDLTKGNFITKGGYIIPICDGKGDPDFCPGVNLSGETIEEFNSKKNSIRTGWSWNTNGTIGGLQPEWMEALEIVGEYKYSLDLLEGYQWKGGFPKLEDPKVGEHCLSVQGYVFENTDSLPFCEASVIGKRRIVLEKSIKESVPAEPKQDSSLKVGKTYLTKGRWLVRINSSVDHYVALDKRTSPGLTNRGRTVYEFYEFKDGDMDGWVLTGNKPLNIDISDELEIVSEYTDKLNPEFPDPPKGYKWKHGFPKLTEVVNREPYVNQYASNYVANSCGIGSSKTWLCLVSEPEKSISPTKESIEKLRSIIESGSNGGTLDLVWGPEILEELTSTDKQEIVKNGWCGTADWKLSFVKDARWDVLTRAMNVLNSGFKKKEEVMKKETATKVAKSVGSFAWKTVNYWLLEPATAWGKKAMSSVRHVVFAGLIFGSFCAYMNPQKTMTVVKSCLPKISVSVEAPEIVR